MAARFKFETDEKGVRVMIDTQTGKRTPVNEVVENAAKEGKLITPEQAMWNKHQKERKKNIDEIEEVEGGT